MTKISLRRRLSDWFNRDDGRVRVNYLAYPNPSEADVEAVRRGLSRYNEKFTSNAPQQRLGCFARDEANRIVAGAHGTITWSWLYIERLWVEEALRGRGVGTEVLARLERLALSEGVFRFHVGTTSFQALDFYLKQGYEVYAQLEDNPPGYTDYSLKKIIDLNP
ncbi:MAG: GNAT family N-acetyltransferase [Pseudomonadota bacterium]